MADSERRVGPTIDLQGFDLTMDMEAVHEPSRLPLVVVIALVVLAAFAGVVWLAYTQGVERGRESVSRELTAQQFWKVRKPAQPAYTGLNIYEPPSEAVQPPAKKIAASTKTGTRNAVPALRPTATAAPDTAPPTVASAPVVSPPQTAAVRAPAKTAPVPNAKPAKPEVQRVATRAPTALTKPAAAPPPTVHPLTEPESLAPAPAAPAMAPKQALPKADSRTSAPVSAPEAETGHAEVKGILLQIGSYKSEAEARLSWTSFRARHDSATGYQPDVKQVELGAKGTWYRLRMGPFPDKAAALEACRKLKADGASCLLAQ